MWKLLFDFRDGLLFMGLILAVSAALAACESPPKRQLTCYDASGRVTFGDNFKECHT